MSTLSELGRAGVSVDGAPVEFGREGGPLLGLALQDACNRPAPLQCLGERRLAMEARQRNLDRAIANLPQRKALRFQLGESALHFAGKLGGLSSGGCVGEFGNRKSPC